MFLRLKKFTAMLWDAIYIPVSGIVLAVCTACLPVVAAHPAGHPWWMMAAALVGAMVMISAALLCLLMVVCLPAVLWIWVRECWRISNLEEGDN